MRHLPSIVFGLLAALFAVLYFTKDATKTEPVAPEPIAAEDPRDTELAELRARTLEQKMRIAQLEVAVLENNTANPDRARFADVPDPEAALANAVMVGPDGEPLSSEEALEAQLGDKIGAALGSLFGGLNMSNVVVSTNSSFSFGEQGLGQAFKLQRAANKRATVESDYADLMGQFDLDFEKRQAFLDLLAKRDEMPFSNGFIDGAAIDKHQEKVEKELAEFLGEEGYERLQEYEDTTYARGKIKAFDEALGRGLALAPEQHEQMKELFNGMESFANDYAENAGKGESEERLDQLAERYTKLTDDASGFLDKQQTAALAAHLDNNLKKAEAHEQLQHQFRDQLGGSLGGAKIQILGDGASSFGFGSESPGGNAIMQIQGLEIQTEKAE